VQMAHFKKASGMDMIIAHRLLKNDVPANEYILATNQYLGQFNKQFEDSGLTWTQGTESYPSIGTVDYAYMSIGHPQRFV